ncbi:MAG: acyl-CoA dehydrogenase family protein [Myxococcota bacterium]
MPRYDTHTVHNQVPPLADYNAFDFDVPLQEAMKREGAGWSLDAAHALGDAIGSADVIEHARLANVHTPVFHSHDRFGHRIDALEFHPSWHAMMKLGVERGLASLPWTRKSAHTGRAALYYLFNQGENGCACPITMTFAVVPALRHAPELAAVWEPRVLSTTYDGRFLPAADKSGSLMGMAMTEKQGGSDVRANSSSAEPLGDGAYLLTGHKWFCSSPHADAFLTLAQSDEGLTCFLVPRFKPDGEKNRFFIQRLKNKLGNRSNPSSEIEYDRTFAQRVGDPGRGVATIINMVHHTRLDCVLGSAGMMRHALVHALHHTRHRKAFGNRLVEQPLMQNVLADLCLEVEGAVALMMRLARSFDAAEDDPREALLGRILAPIAKYWVCKRNTSMVSEALECHGGNGYVEDAPIARLFRDAPLNGIWEGSGNVICLDVLRALQRSPESGEVLADFLNEARGESAVYDAHVDACLRELRSPDGPEFRARRLVEGLAVAIQTGLLIQHAPGALLDAFAESRLQRDGGLSFGTLSPKTDFTAILERFPTP